MGHVLSSRYAEKYYNWKLKALHMFYANSILMGGMWQF